ncbi:hypothetical protein CTI12_AA077940 [Artemisia annua]|uniref:Uncharacterized protein n=1 Tax=Artemisia annua TaxID=35608 RepID=A0A2U1Q3U1_ARTAN|nr:hypothetical protein CTI12_AA077940 [Artemisia annua]
MFLHIVIDKGLENLEALGKRISKLKVMFASLKKVKEAKMAKEAKAIAKLDEDFGRAKEAQEPQKQNNVIVIESDSDTSLEFYEDILKKPSTSLVKKTPSKTRGKTFQSVVFLTKTKQTSSSKPKMLSWYLPQNIHQVLNQVVIQLLLMRVMMQKTRFK